MVTKVCNKCNVDKDVTEFYFYKGSNKFYTTCKVCYKKSRKDYYRNNKESVSEKNKIYREKNKDRVKKWQKEYRENNKEYISKLKKEWKENNKEYIRKRDKKYYEDNKESLKENKRLYYLKNKESLKEKHRLYYLKNIDKKKKYFEDNKERTLKYLRDRRKNDPLYRLKINLKSTLSHNFKRNGYTKKSRSFEILGCSYVDFKEYIESQFEDWMSWDNYGLYNGEEKYGWDLDHIVPLSSAECEGDIIRLNHYSNIQPLCSYVNRDVKRDNIDWKS